MLFEAMPLSLHSNKRKGQHIQEDLPVPKKLAVDSQVVARNGQSALLIDLSETGGGAGGLSLPNYLHQIPASSAAERRKAMVDAKLAHSEPDNVHAAATCHPLSSHENGISSSVNGSVNIDILSESGESEESDDSSVYDMGGSHSGHKSTRNLESSQERSMKQPSLVLKDVKRNSAEKGKASSDRIAIDSSKPLYEYGGYMRRMASLNASACVTAMMEPEKKFRPHKPNHKKSHTQEFRRTLSLSSNDDPTYQGMTLMATSPHRGDSHRLDKSSSPGGLHMLSSSSISSSEADTSKDSDEILDANTTPQVYTLIALASLAASRESELDIVPFNTLGLLYNGDTVHPSSRVFYTSDTDLTLPVRIIPKVVPSRETFVDSAITDAVALRVVNQKRKRKAAKVRSC